LEMIFLTLQITLKLSIEDGIHYILKNSSYGAIKEEMNICLKN